VLTTLVVGYFNEIKVIVSRRIGLQTFIPVTLFQQKRDARDDVQNKDHLGTRVPGRPYVRPYRVAAVSQQRRVRHGHDLKSAALIGARGPT